MTEILNNPVDVRSLVETGVDVELETFVVACIADDTVSSYKQVLKTITQLNNYHHETKDINDIIAPPRLVIRETGTSATEDIAMYIAEELGWEIDNIKADTADAMLAESQGDYDILLCFTGNEQSRLANLAKQHEKPSTEIRIVT